MAYSTTNGPYAMTPPAIGGGFVVGSSDAKGNLYYYQSTHAATAYQVTGFFTDAKARGMHVGDIVFAWDSGNSRLVPNVVSAISTAGAGTLAAWSTA